MRRRGRGRKVWFQAVLGKNTRAHSQTRACAQRLFVSGTYTHTHTLCHSVSVSFYFSLSVSLSPPLFPANPCAVSEDNILHGEPGLRLDYCGRALEVGRDGKGVFVQGTTTLAGSSLSLWDCFLSLVREQRQSMAHACNMLSATPARIAKLAQVGALSTSFHADILLASEDLALEATLIGGVPAFSASKH